MRHVGSPEHMTTISGEAFVSCVYMWWMGYWVNEEWEKGIFENILPSLVEPVWKDS